MQMWLHATPQHGKSLLKTEYLEDPARMLSADFLMLNGKDALFYAKEKQRVATFFSLLSEEGVPAPSNLEHLFRQQFRSIHQYGQRYQNLDLGPYRPEYLDVEEELSGQIDKLFATIKANTPAHLASKQKKMEQQTNWRKTNVDHTFTTLDSLPPVEEEDIEYSLDDIRISGNSITSLSEEPFEMPIGPMLTKVCFLFFLFHSFIGSSHL